ncbi:DNA repair protein [Ferrimonas sp. SCSIO 43195]|uniref:DNA repair protein n=1 Tax=Ferrimonas sp. SCSIO 43195 TaxID=2822844 RepID=UPI002075872C|nr:DNA repair protein [Ferrimonas sp. SCSIO 43195]USD39147.1 DNA repair protein [Ferrimonas sp. SCSIO 43195]
MLGRVWNAVSSGVSAVVDKVTQGCSKAWNAVTGKDKFLEAERLHKQTIRRFEKEQRSYQEAVQSKSLEIENQLKAINGFKLSIFEQQFPRFVALANRLHNVRVAGSHFEEFFDDNILEVTSGTGVRSKQQLFEIDFNNLSFKELALSILTLGIFSRKKAAESLQQVKDEVCRIDEEIAKMAAQLAKIDQVVTSIDTVALYFERLISNYAALLERFEYGINTQRIVQMGVTPELFREKLDFRLLPVVHIEEFQALFNLSVVLKQMSQMAYLSEQGEVVHGDTEAAQALFDKAQQIQAA